MVIGDYFGIVIIGVLALAFGLGSMALSQLLAPSRPTPEKLDPYECGIVPEQETAERFPVQFYLVAVIFIALDVEIMFLYPWATRLRGFETYGLIVAAVFIAIQLVAFIWILREGILNWAPERKTEREDLMAQFRADAAAAQAAIDGDDDDPIEAAPEDHDVEAA